jgi:hypothetical protein
MPLEEFQPTPAQVAEYNSLPPDNSPAPPGAGTEINPIRDLSAHDLADLQVKELDKFDLVSEFRANKDLWSDPNLVSKVAEAHNLIRQRGFQFSDLPGPKKIAGQVFDVAKGLGKQVWNYAKLPVAAGAGLLSTIGAVEPGTAEEMSAEAQRGAAEAGAGTEQAVFGLGRMAQKAIGKAGQLVGLVKKPADLTPEEKQTDLWNAVGAGETESDIARGHGAAMTAAGGEVVKQLESQGKPIRPEETTALAAGDPFSFYAFGKGISGAGKLVPGVVASAAGTVGEKAGEAAAKVGGNLAQAAGGVIKAAGPVSEFGGKVLKVVGPVYQVGKAAVTGDIGEAFHGGVATRFGGAALQELGENAAKIGQRVSSLGKQVAGEVPMVSPYAQLGRDVLQAAPGAVGELGKGSAFDLGTAAVSSESPQDTQSIGLGTAFGLLGAGKHLAAHTISGQLIAPREYGINKVIPSSGQFPGLDAMNSDAMQSASPGQRTRLNAVRLFAKGAAPGTDVFMAKDSASLQSALEQAGFSPDDAQHISQQEGFFSTNIPGKDGKPRRVIIAKNIDSAPHEAFHAVQDVLGEQANQAIDKIVQREYAGQWEQEGQKYTSRLVDNLGDTPWREALLDNTGLGRAQAVEKIYTDIANQIRSETGGEPADSLVKDQATKAWQMLTDEAQKRNPQAAPEQIQSQIWKDILSPEEVKAAGDQYLARELAAENFDAAFKAQGGDLNAKPALPQKLARIAGNMVSFLGGEPLAGRQTEIGQIQPRSQVVEAVTGAARARLPGVTPATEKPVPAPPRGSVTPAQAAEQARELAAEAPETPPAAGGTRSARELLGAVAEAIATRQGVKLNYLSAPDEPAAATSSNRETRRAIIEAWRTMPPEARALWEKNFFPETVRKTKGGKYQIQGWAPEVFASNAHKLARALADANASGLSPYPIDAATKTFTPEGWRDLYSDVQTFTQNQIAGATGAGEPLIVPKTVTERGYFAPPTTGKTAGLEQTRADFINTLFGFRLPDTARMQKGKLPQNIAGQEVSAATKPGRAEIPIRPRGEFTGPEAAAQSIEGRPIMEVNPLRQKIEAAMLTAKTAMPSLVEAWQNLNLENIKEVDLAPEQPEFRGKSLTLLAGFQPKLAEEPEAVKRAAIRTRTGKIYPASPDNITHGGALMNAESSGEDARSLLGATEGFVTNSGEFLDRKQAFKRAKDYGQITGDEFMPKPGQLESVSFEHAMQFQPKPELPAEFSGPVSDSAERFADMPQDQWQKTTVPYKGRFGGGLTGLAHEVGAAARTPEDVAALKSVGERMQEMARSAMKNGDYEKAMQYGARRQAANEAHQAATGVNFDGQPAAVGFIKEHYDPNYEPPVPAKGYVSAEIQAQPKANPEVQKLAEDYSKKAGIEYAAPGNYAQIKPDLMKRIADFYDTEKHNPDSTEVKSSYGALAKETVAQFKAIQDAGYTIEPFSGKGEPYKSSGDMVQDVTQNKHLYYLPTGEAFGAAGEPQNNLMLADSGIEMGGKPAPINDIFRAVHDFFGHAKEGLQFGPRGEFNAWREHSGMYSPEAQGALAAETLAQNSFVNFGAHLRNAEGNIPARGEPGFVEPGARRFAEQKNTVVPPELIQEAQGQFQPKRKPKDEAKLLPGGPEGVSKAWILPSGRIEQLGGQWHHHWLAEDEAGKAAAKKAGLDIPPFEGTDTEGVRESALQAGFARVNYGRNTGTLTVEARAKDWRKLKPSVEKIVESNLDDIDNMRVHLLDDKAGMQVDTMASKLFNYDTDAEKLQHIPFITEGEIRGGVQFQPKLSEEPEAIKQAAIRTPNGKIYLSHAGDTTHYGALKLAQDAGEPVKTLKDVSDGFITNGGEFLSREQAFKRAKEYGQITGEEWFPKPGRLESVTFEGATKGDVQFQPKQKSLFGEREALSPQVVNDMTKEELGQHFPEAVIPRKRTESIPSNITGSPLYKAAGSEDKAVRAFGNKLADFAREYEDHPIFQAGSQWYSKFAPMLKNEFGADAPVMAELLAATSPQTNVETNFGYALDALESLKSGRFDRQIKKFGQGLDMLANDTWQSWYAKENKAGRIPEPPAQPTPAAFLEHWIDTHDLKPTQSNGKLYGQHSLPVLQVFARRWLDLNKGPKTRNFVENLLGDSHEATIDLWADRTMRRVGYSDSKERWRILPQNKSGVSDEDFAFAQKAFRHAAEQLGMKPDALQGALWFAEKQLWADNGWSKLDLGDFRNEMAKLPLLRRGIQYRLSATEARAGQKTAHETELNLIQPRR